MIYTLGSTYVINNTYRFMYFESFLNPWNKDNLLTVNILLDVIMNSITTHLLRNFVSMFAVKFTQFFPSLTFSLALSLSESFYIKIIPGQ